MWKRIKAWWNRPAPVNTPTHSMSDDELKDEYTQLYNDGVMTALTMQQAFRLQCIEHELYTRKIYVHTGVKPTFTHT